jgi:hypothetical protein
MKFLVFYFHIKRPGQLHITLVFLFLIIIVAETDYEIIINR